ncbi:MAG: phosphate ABC transporter permease PstA [Pseudomonadales bacterium]
MSLTNPRAQLKQRKLLSNIFHAFCTLCTFAALAVLALLLYKLFRAGLPWLDWQFLSSFPSRNAELAGIKSALFGTLWLVTLTALFAVPTGVLAAIYLQEYAPANRISRWVELNIANLAGVPSIVYGVLGLALFVRFFEFQRSLLAGALTMALLILPIIIIAAKEALAAVPTSIREAAYGVGASRWQVVWAHVLPTATPSIMTGVILALSRAVGETAPLLVMGALAYVAFVPTSPMDEFTTLPVQIFNWAARPQDEFHGLAAAAILVLLGILLITNSAALAIRYWSSK